MLEAFRRAFVEYQPVARQLSNPAGFRFCSEVVSVASFIRWLFPVGFEAAGFCFNSAKRSRNATVLNREIVRIIVSNHFHDTLWMAAGQEPSSLTNSGDAPPESLSAASLFNAHIQRSQNRVPVVPRVVSRTKLIGFGLEWWRQLRGNGCHHARSKDQHRKESTIHEAAPRSSPNASGLKLAFAILALASGCYAQIASNIAVSCPSPGTQAAITWTQTVPLYARIDTVPPGAVWPPSPNFVQQHFNGTGPQMWSVPVTPGKWMTYLTAPNPDGSWAQTMPVNFTCIAPPSTQGVIVDAETPAGAIDGVNAIFTLAVAPNPASSLVLFQNGLRLRVGDDYNLSGNTITFLPGAIPKIRDTLVASYRHP